MSKIVASADITLLDFSVLLDFSNATPTAKITNLSTVVNAANLEWVFEFLSPSNTPIHVGDFSDPDVDNVAFVDYTFAEQIPLVMGQLEFSNNAAYSIKVSVKDLAGAVASLTKSASLCKPNGNNNKNNFGVADVSIEVKCGSRQLHVTDKTNLVYKNITGTKYSTSVEVTYPKDENGNTIAPVVVNSIPALLPIEYEGDGHEVYVVHKYDYDLGDNFNVRVRYSFSKVFGVWCNVNLQPLLCEVSKVTKELSENCYDTSENREKHRKLGLANSKILQAVIGVMQPLTGFDVPAIVEDVKRILQIECDCCRPLGIPNAGGVLLADAILTVNKVCGDMTLSWGLDVSGNIVLNYQDKSYTFKISGSDAFDWGLATTGCNKENTLEVDIAVLAEEILTDIINNPTLLNILNSATQRAQLSCSGLDGGDAFDFTTCDYSIEIDTSAVGKTFVSILIGGVTYTAPTGTLITAASSIQTYLNSLSKGTFVVSYSSGTNKLTITTAANSNAISTVTTLVGSTSTTAQFNNNCGLICTILQRILDYINGLNMLQVKAGGAISVCKFNTSTGAVVTTSFLSTHSSYLVVAEIANSICNVVNYMSTRLVSCANVKALFTPMTSQVIDGADTVPMWIDGACVMVPMKNFAMSIFTLLKNDSDVKSIYCQVSPCSTVSTCSPVSGLSGSIADTSANYTWSAVAGATGYKWSINGTTYFSVTSTAANVTGLTADTAYVFRVYPIYASGDGSACEVTSNFTTTDAGAACSAPGSLVLDNVTTSSFRASWATVTGATGYQYRVNGGGWINAGLVLTVTIGSLTDDTLYNFEVRAIIGGTPCAESSTDSVTTVNILVENIFIGNLATGLSIDAVTLLTDIDFISIISGAYPIATGESVRGEHGNISGQIVLTVSGTFSASTAKVYVNSVFRYCLDLTGAGDYVFTTDSYTGSEFIEIQVDEGAC